MNSGFTHHQSLLLAVLALAWAPPLHAQENGPPSPEDKEQWLAWTKPPSIDEGLRRLELTSDELTRAHLIVQLTYYAGLDESDPRRAIELNQQALELARKLELPRVQLTALVSLSWSHRVLGKYEEALAFALEAKAVEEAHALEDTGGIIANNLGNLYTQIGQYDEALAILTEAYEKALDAGTAESALASYLGNIGRIYAEVGDHQTALEIRQKELAAIRKYDSPNSLRLAISLGNLGSSNMALGHYEEALSLLNESMEVSKRIGDEAGVAITYERLAHLYLLEGDLQRARVAVEEAFPLTQALGAVEQIAENRNLAAEIYQKLQRFDEASTAFAEALRTAETHTLKDERIRAAKGLWESYRDAGRKDEALAAVAQYLTIRDEQEESLLDQSLAEMRVQFRTEQAHRENEILRQEKQIAVLRADREAAIRMALLAGLAIVGLLVIYLVWRYRLRVKQHRELAQANAALKQAESALIEARDNALRANRAKSLFLANMSHELRTPLNAILGFSQILARSESISGNDRKSLETIGRSGSHLLNLINSVLDMSKMEDGSLELLEDDFDLFELLHELEELFQFQAGKKGLRFELELDADLPQYIHADSLKLRQVLINLLNNAIKFTPHGEVRLEARPIVDESRETSRAGSSTAFLSFSVADTGVGIAAGELSKLFQLFTQTESGRSSRQGTGLGLALSKRLAELMGGTISVESTQGLGTTFSIKIPVRRTSTMKARTSAPSNQVVGLQPGQQPVRMLVIDDNEDNRSVLTQLLESVGFPVEAAADGQEGLERWQKHRPDMVWMDMRMPVMDGYEATRRIKQEARAHNLPVVVVAITASALNDDQEQIRAAGCDDFVVKPFRESDVFTIIQKHQGVRYVYQEPALTFTDPTDPAKGIDQALQEGIRSLNSALQARLHRAAEVADVDEAEAIAAEIARISPTTGELLQDVVSRFQFDLILTATQDHASAQPARKRPLA